MTTESSTPDVWAQVHAGLALFSRPFPHETVALAEAHREDVAPRLVGELEALAADPFRFDDDYMLHVYAMHLLAWWRDGRALAPLLALGHMRDHQRLDDLFGDHLTESFGRCLASVCGGDLQPLMALADDANADVWARSAALQAITVCVVEGDASRDEAIAYAKDLAEREAAAVRSGSSANEWGFDFLNSAVDLAIDLCAVEMLPAIRGWFDEELVEEVHADLPFVEEWIMEPFDEAAQRVREQRKGYVGDPVSEMAWWACFTEDEDDDEFEFDELPVTQPYVREGPKIGRNDPCPCGSGKKYKKCHGAA